MFKLKIFYREELERESIAVVRELGRHVGVKAPASMRKNEIIDDIILIQSGKKQAVINSTSKGAPIKSKIDLTKFRDRSSEPFESESVNLIPLHSTDYVEPEKGLITMEGILELHMGGFGFLRVNNYENSSDDVYVSPASVSRFNLRRGDKVKAVARPSKEPGAAPALKEVLAINDLDPKLYQQRKNFDDLTPCYPNRRLKLANFGGADEISIRCIDLFSPIGRGQRGLIVAPPKTGKTTLLRMIAQSIERAYKDVKVIVLLIDERPEEVTDMKGAINGEVVFSTFDENPEHHIRAAELVINRAKRLVEVGKDVVILLDSITRLVRAYNSVVASSGKTLSGGLDPTAMQGPKRLFGSARNTDDGGSLTILATALIDTGSRMDDVIYEEFKGTGNMEIFLSRELSEKRVFPAIDLLKSGTRNEGLILSIEEVDTSRKIRRIISNKKESTDGVLDMLKRTSDNEEFISKLDAWLKLCNK